MNNTARVARAIWALRQYGEEGEDRVTDLLTDLRHYCAQDPPSDFDTLLRRSLMHYEAEARGDDECL